MASVTQVFTARSTRLLGRMIDLAGGVGRHRGGVLAHGGVLRHGGVLAHGGVLTRPAVLLATLTSPTPSDFKPTAGSLPGGAALLHLVNGLGGWALMLSLAGLVLGAALWALGAHSQNYQQSYVGRRAVLVSGLAALLIGAAPTLIDFFFSTGHGIVNPLPQ